MISSSLSSLFFWRCARPAVKSSAMEPVSSLITATRWPFQMKSQKAVNFPGKKSKNEGRSQKSEKEEPKKMQKIHKILLKQIHSKDTRCNTVLGCGRHPGTQLTERYGHSTSWYDITHSIGCDWWMKTRWLVVRGSAATNQDYPISDATALQHCLHRHYPYLLWCYLIIVAILFIIIGSIKYPPLWRPSRTFLWVLSWLNQKSWSESTFKSICNTLRIKGSVWIEFKFCLQI